MQASESYARCATLQIAERRGLYVIEDNAHGIFSFYKGRALGTIGHLGAMSFHYTKNINIGEGGALAINSDELMRKAMVAWEKGTNRLDFVLGEAKSYWWVDKGSSFVMSEILSAVLSAQLEHRQETFAARGRIWDLYFDRLAGLEKTGRLVRPFVTVRVFPFEFALPAWARMRSNVTRGHYTTGGKHVQLPHLLPPHPRPSRLRQNHQHVRRSKHWDLATLCAAALLAWSRKIC